MVKAGMGKPGVHDSPGVVPDPVWWMVQEGFLQGGISEQEQKRGGAVEHGEYAG